MVIIIVKYGWQYQIWELIQVEVTTNYECLTSCGQQIWAEGTENFSQVKWGDHLRQKKQQDQISAWSSVFKPSISRGGERILEPPHVFKYGGGSSRVLQGYRTLSHTSLLSWGILVGSQQSNLSCLCESENRKWPAPGEKEAPVHTHGLYVCLLLWIKRNKNCM